MSRRSRAIAATIWVAAVAGIGAAWYAGGGAEQFLGFCVGAVVGTVTWLLGRLPFRGQLEARGRDFGRSVLIGSLFSLVIFAALVIVVGRLWRAAVLPVVLTALPLYFSLKLLDAVSASGLQEAAREAERHEKSRAKPDRPRA